MQFLCQFLADLWKWAKDCVFRMLVRSDFGPYFDQPMVQCGPACKYFGGQSTASGRNHRKMWAVPNGALADKVDAATGFSWEPRLSLGDESPIS